MVALRREAKGLSASPPSALPIGPGFLLPYETLEQTLVGDSSLLANEATCLVSSDTSAGC